MSADRRLFLKKIAMGWAGLLAGGAVAGEEWPSAWRQPGAGKTGKGVFPFFLYISRYNIGDYLPKDQGGMFIQMEIFGTQDDKAIVQKIREGVLKRVYGDPIQWSRFENTGVEKSVWLNRFYYLPSFARLYYLTGDKSYVDEMMQLISGWIKDNPLEADSSTRTYNWRDMQVAWRSIHLSWCFFLCEKALTQEQQDLLTESLSQHAGILLSGFGRQPLNEFNHQSHGALAMLYLGVLFPSLERSGELKDRSLTILSHHLGKAFYPDGGNLEQMFGYYPFETHIFRDAWLLCIGNGVTPPPGLPATLEKMARFLSAVSQPDGTMPPVNDSYEMATVPILATLSAILDKKFHPGSEGPVYFPDSQLAVMRQSDHRNSWYVLAYPAQAIGGHDHAGRLALTVWFNGSPVLIDSGCLNYDDPRLVTWFRTSRAHNTALIDGRSDDATSSSRLWTARRDTANRITAWLTDKDYLFCQMLSPASEMVNNSVTWYRNVALVRNKLLIVHDRFDTKGRHDYEILFHFPPGKTGLSILPAEPGLTGSPLISEGMVTIKGMVTPAPMATYKFSGEGPIHAVFVLTPQTDRPHPMDVRQKITDDGIAISIDQGSGKPLVLLIRNCGSEEMTALGRRTRKLFEVFDGPAE